MRKLFNFLVCAVVVLLATACSFDDLFAPKEKQVVIKASFEDYTTTRMSLDGYKPVWEIGDEIVINGTVFTTRTAGEEATFTTTEAFDVELGSDIYAVYGAMTVAYEQEARENNMPVGTPAYAEGVYSENTELSFKNPAALLKFTSRVTGDLQFYSVGGESLSGRLSVNGEDVTVSDGTSTVYIKGCRENHVYYVAVAPATLSEGLCVMCGNYTLKEGAVGQVLESNKIYDLGELALPEDVEPVLDDWAVVGTFNNWENAEMDPLGENLYVVQNLTMDAYDRFKIRSISREWELNFGATESVYNVYPNSWIPAMKKEYLGVNEEGVGIWTEGEPKDVYVVEARAYDIYFLCNDIDLEYKIYVVESGTAYTDATEQTENGPDQEVVPVEDNWSVVGTFNEWDPSNGLEMVFDADEDAYVARDVIFEATTTNAFKFVLNNSWDGNIGIGEGETLVLGEWMTSYASGVDIPVDAGTYNIYLSADTSKFKVVKLENNVPVDPSLAWAVSGIFTNWEAISMSATDVDNLYVFAGAKIGAYERFQIVNSKATFGSAFKNVYADRWVDAYLIADGASDLYVIEEGVYDIYFYADAATTDYRIYLMSAGVPYTEATKQTENGPEQVVAGGGYKIYLYKENAWNMVNLYAWHFGTQNTILNAWPGKAYDGTEVIGDYTYYYWEMPAAANDVEDMMIIFNDGSGLSSEQNKTDDYGPYTLSGDLYFLLEGREVTPIDDPENPFGTPVEDEQGPTTRTEEYGVGVFTW